jgi:DnaJ family protein C protein 8
MESSSLKGEEKKPEQGEPTGPNEKAETEEDLFYKMINNDTTAKKEQVDLPKSQVKIEEIVQETKEEITDEKEAKPDPLMDLFYSEINDIKTEDFKTTSKEQLDRLLRPGSTYFNLNPFEVLQIDPYMSVEDIKKKYRKLTLYVHPDRNAHDKERAEIAFSAVNKAYKMLSDEKERKQCLEVVDEARERVDTMCGEKRKKLKKDLDAAKRIAAAAATKKLKETDTKTESEPLPEQIDEDDPDKYRHAIYVMTCKLFADIERLKVREMEKKAEEKKRKAEETAENEVKSKTKKEFDTRYEESRQDRISSWQDFKKKPGDFKKGSKPLPKFKPETR